MKGPLSTEWFTRFSNSALHPGLRVMIASVVLGALFCVPLLLYIAFGPEDGNPIGLGLLAVMGLPGAVLGFLAGLVWFVKSRSK